MIRKKSKALCVPLSEAEQVRRYLKEQKILRMDVKLLKEGGCIFFPIMKTQEELPDFPLVIRSFETRTEKVHCYKDLLKIPKKLEGELPTSFDIVGSIILLKLPESLFRYRKQIGQALLETHPHIRTVCLVDPVAGEHRTRNITVIAGENRTLTTHTEYGLAFQVDVASAYFSPRLATERKRIAAQVKKGEVVVDLFTGVAPFAIMIARFAKPKAVYAVDKNREAIDLARQNVKLNHVLDIVEVVHGDAKDAGKILPVKADRIIMNLPFSAYNFFSVALSIAASECKVHYYDIIREEEIEGRIISLKDIAQTHGYSLTQVLVHKIKSYAPREFYIGLDITATTHADVA